MLDGDQCGAEGDPCAEEESGILERNGSISEKKSLLSDSNGAFSLLWVFVSYPELLGHEALCKISLHLIVNIQHYEDSS